MLVCEVHLYNYKLLIMCVHQCGCPSVFMCSFVSPQVHALELEQELADERTRLAELRKVHYHLGGSQEGWEETVSILLAHVMYIINFLL